MYLYVVNIAFYGLSNYDTTSIFFLVMKRSFLPGSGRIDTAVWMHYLDADKNAWRRN